MSNWSKQLFVIKKNKNTVPWTYVNSDLHCEEIVGTFYKKGLQKTNEKEFRVEKVIAKRGVQLYVKWESRNNFLNSWIDKKDIVL